MLPPAPSLSFTFLTSPLYNNELEQIVFLYKCLGKITNCEKIILIDKTIVANISSVRNKKVHKPCVERWHSFGSRPTDDLIYSTIMHL